MRIPRFVCVWVGCGAIGYLGSVLGLGIGGAVAGSMLWMASIEALAPRGDA